MENRNQSSLDQRNPQDIPNWHLLRRETALVRHLIGSGVTSLGRASYADKMGEYYIAFFGLSIGLERLAKLILVLDYVITNNSQMPSDRVVSSFSRKYGHKLVKLLNAVVDVTDKHGLKLDYTRPTTQVSSAIVECLDAFADAGRGRYANFAALGSPKLGQDEPISKWWSNVAELILAEHYFGKPAQKRVEDRAQEIDALMAPCTTIHYSNETGDALNDVRSASTLTGKTEFVQRYGRFYALCVVRWLSDVFSQLSRLACCEHHVDAFFGVWECLDTYCVNDSYLKTRKMWP